MWREGANPIWLGDWRGSIRPMSTKFRWYGVEDRDMLICGLCFRKTADAAMASKFQVIRDKKRGYKYHLCIRCGHQELDQVHAP